jgi:lipoate-protein ligase A
MNINQWRFISTEVHDAATNMALDEACMQHVREGKVAPTIRFYRWKPSAISVGYFQSLAREIDAEVCKKLGVDMVRRQTGGGAVYHDYEGELTYSVIAPEGMFDKNIIQSYKEICGWIIDGLKTLGIDSEFIPINDIVSGSKKISGNAQTRKGGILLQHGTILYGVDVKKMFSLLKVPDEKMRDKMIQVVEERVTSLKDIKPDLTFEQLEKALWESFGNEKKIDISAWTESELTLAHQLYEEKYSTNEWVAMR